MAQGGGYNAMTQPAADMAAVSQRLNTIMRPYNTAYSPAQADMSRAWSRGYDPSMARASAYQAAQAGSQGYGAAQAGSQGYGAAQAGSQGYGAAQAGSQGYGAARVGGFGSVDPSMINAGQISETDFRRYMNPFTGQVINRALGDLDRARDISVSDISSRAASSGAWGGSRHGVAEAETNRAYLDQAGDMAANLRQNAFSNAQNMAQFDIGNRFAADQANQGAGLAAQTTNAANQLAAGLANQGAQNAARQFGAQAGNTAALQNAAYKNAARQFGAQAGNVAALQNAAAQNDARQFGAQAGNTAALQNAAYKNAARQFGAQAGNTAALQNAAAQNDARAQNARGWTSANMQNAAARNTAGQFGANAFNTASLQNSAQRNNMSLANMNAANQASQFNRSNALANRQQDLQAAQSLAGLSQQGFNMGNQINQNLSVAGGQQQALVQSLIDAARAQYGGFSGSPMQGLSPLLQALGAVPVPQTQRSGYQPGLLDVLSGIGGFMGAL